MQETPAPILFKCRMCGLESPLKEAFIQHKGLFLGSAQTYCFECSAKRQWRSLLVGLLVMMVVAAMLYLVMPTGFFGRVLLQMLAALLVLLVPLIVLHELAHVLAARLVGLRVFQVHIGAGPLVGSARFFHVRWHLHWLPVSGATVVAGPQMPAYRWRQFLVLLAGPAMHALLILVSWRLLLDWSLEAVGGPLHILVTLLFWINIALMISNLIPRRVAISTGIAGTDGGAMLKLLFKPGDLQHSYHRAYYVHEVVDAVDRGDFDAARRWSEDGSSRYPQDALIANAVGYMLISAGDYQAARQTFLRVLAFDGLEEVVRAMGMNNVAYTNFMLADPTLQSEAGSFSEEAYARMPWEPAVVGTRGAVLIWLGQYDEGLILLRQALVKTPDRRNRAANASILAWGEHLRGGYKESQKYLDLARKLDPKSPALARVLPDIG